MKPGLVIKLRPSGPWRIGPDSGARNRVDVIYHSDSLYSAVTSAMGRFGLLQEWLQATVKDPAPAVCFSSCFPFLNEIGLVVPPRTVWPPRVTSLASARVRWKSARFVPLEVVRAILAGESLNEDHWTVDGPSECLLPTGQSGPFRIGVRWNSAVDRLTGASERHGTACIEFRPGAGLWMVAGFRDDQAHTQWLEPVKAAFRWLADSGFGGERSRGWGRAAQPEFIEGSLPDMILPEQEDKGQGPVTEIQIAAVAEQEVELPPTMEAASPVQEPPGEPSPVPPIQDPPLEPPPDPEIDPPAEPHLPEEDPQLPPPDPDPPFPTPPFPEPSPVFTAVDAEPVAEAAMTHPVEEPLPLAVAPVEADRPAPVWLLSLFSPAAADTVDWRRGNYTVLARGGRVDSPAGSGELKKQVQMVVEGSVLYAAGDPRGAAPDVAPDGFAHPVFRAGFALAIPLPEVS